MCGKSMAKNVAIDTQSALKKELRNQKQAEQPKHHQNMRIEARFGHHVRWYRKQRHLTQDQLAFMSGLNQNYISEIERGQRNVTLRVMENVAKALGVKEVDLLK